MPSNKFEKLIQLHERQCNPLWRERLHCARETYGVKPVVKSVNPDALQNLEIKALKQEVAQLKKTIKIFSSLVDAADVEAAFELLRITPTTAQQLLMAQKCGKPEGIEDEPEERPW